MVIYAHLRGHLTACSVHSPESSEIMSGVNGRLLRLALALKTRAPCLREAAHFTVTTRKLQQQTPQNERTKPEVKSNAKRTQRALRSPSSQFDADLRDSPDVAAALRLLDTYYVDVEAAVKLLRRVWRLAQSSENVDTSGLDSLLVGGNFEQLTLVLHNKVAEISLPNLLSAIEALLTISQEDIFLTTSLETQILWLLKSMAFNDIIKVMLIHNEHQETELRKKVYEHALSQVSERCGEIRRPQDIVTLMYLVNPNNKSLLSKLENRALEMSDNLSGKDMLRILSLLSQRQRRNKPLVQKTVSVLSDPEVPLGLQQVQNILYSCINLHIFDVAFLRRLTDVLMAGDGSGSYVKSPRLAAGLLWSLSTLRWRDEQLLDRLSEAILADIPGVTNQDLLAVLLTSANLDYFPEPLAKRLDDMVQRLEETADQNPRQWLDVAWSCAVLRRLSAKMANHVLDPKFTDVIQSRDAGREAPGKPGIVDIAAIKLRNLVSAAHHEVAGYTGPHTSQVRMKVPVRLNRVTLGTVMKALSRLAPADDFLTFDVPHPSGFNIDIELLVDGRGRPVAKQTEPAAGTCRLAFKVLDFADMSVGQTLRPTGLHVMAIRHLRHHGYKVIPIPYTDVQDCENEAKMAEYLKVRIEETVNTKKQEES